MHPNHHPKHRCTCMPPLSITRLHVQCCYVVHIINIKVATDCTELFTGIIVPNFMRGKIIIDVRGRFHVSMYQNAHCKVDKTEQSLFSTEQNWEHAQPIIFEQPCMLYGKQTREQINIPTYKEHLFRHPKDCRRVFTCTVTSSLLAWTGENVDDFA